MVLVLRVEDTAEDRPEALALDHPDGRVILAMMSMWSVITQRETTNCEFQALVIFSSAKSEDVKGYSRL